MFVEVNVQVRDPVVSLRIGFGVVGLHLAKRLLSEVGRVAYHRIETGLGTPWAPPAVEVDLGELYLPMEEAMSGSDLGGLLRIQERY